MSQLLKNSKKNQTRKNSQSVKKVKASNEKTDFQDKMKLDIDFLTFKLSNLTDSEITQRKKELDSHILNAHKFLVNIKKQNGTLDFKLTVGQNKYQQFLIQKSVFNVEKKAHFAKNKQIFANFESDLIEKEFQYIQKNPKNISKIDLQNQNRLKVMKKFNLDGEEVALENRLILLQKILKEKKEQNTFLNFENENLRNKINSQNF